MLRPQVIKTAAYLVLLTLLTACGGGSGSSDNTFSDPANMEGVALEDQIVLAVETLNTVTGQSTNSINSLEPLTIRVTLKNGRNRAIAQNIVSLSSTLGTLNSSTGDTLTNGNGEVTVELAVFDELPGTAGTITVSHLDETLDVFFTVEKAPVSIGSTRNGIFSRGTIDILAPSISAGGETVLSVSILDALGNPLGRDFPPMFTSDCTSSMPPLASIGRVEYTLEGEATAVYLAEGCTGSDVIQVEIAGLVGHTAEGQVEIQTLGAVAIRYTDADFPTLGLIDSNSNTLPDNTLITFTVTDTNGDPASNVPVTFGLSSTVGGIGLETDSARTDAEGTAVTRIFSGSIPTAVRVTATLTADSGNITAISEDILISSGRPDQSSFSVAADILNPGGETNDGITATILVSAADRFNSPVPDGTVVFFRTEYGRVTASCTTDGGVCSVPWRSQDPRRPLFSSFTDDDGNPGLVRTLLNTDCPSGGNSRGKPCPDFLGHPIGGRSTIQAYTAGDESFIDANANGLYDTGESFVDLPEAFLDHNEDGEFGNETTLGSCYPDCVEPGGNEETFIDKDNSGSYTKENGDYNGSLCSGQSIAEGNCAHLPVTVSDNVVLLMSGSEPYGAFYSGTFRGKSPLNSITVSSVDRSFLFYASDVFNGKLPNGTTVEVSSTSCTLSGAQSFSVGNRNSLEPSIFSITVKGGTNDAIVSGNIDVTVSVPGIGTSTVETYSIACRVDACSIQPAPAFCSAGGS